jgi:hypothetical protein
MKLPSTPIEKNIKSVVSLVLQMSLAALLFCVFIALSVDGKPVVEDDPICGYEVLLFLVENSSKRCDSRRVQKPVPTPSTST